MSSTGSEDPTSAMDQKKRKRMLSNRDSARRSRMRKQQRLDELSAKESELRDENRRVANTLQAVRHNCRAVGAENRVLRTQAMELRARLESLHGILNYMSAASNDCLFSVPWNLLMINQPMMAPGDMNYYC
ncbi:uncharacterized protein M6B38_155385 [Iris pallida]|uniref:BZIP domain-containing protein n=1 Tax=Iris pallida TaxID=29817 RepID=A0AAX6F4Z2_IRIPA|nr:uncharacterized protein M6B38_155385 [Iris pallida]